MTSPYVSGFKGLVKPQVTGNLLIYEASNYLNGNLPIYGAVIPILGGHTVGAARTFWM